ncbi:unnamed protein product, partial [Chrysoparadoxa australica]
MPGLCVNFAGKVEVHHYLRDELRTALIRNGVMRANITKEDKACFHGPDANVEGHPKWQKDLTIANGALAHAGEESFAAKDVLIDVTIRNPVAKRQLLRYGVGGVHGGPSDAQAGSTAARAENEQRVHYQGAISPATATFIPFAVEAYGCIRQEATDFLKAVATQRAHTLQSVEGVPVAWGKAKCLGRLRQAVSVALQVALSRRELGFLRNMRSHRVGQGQAEEEEEGDEGGGGSDEGGG